MKKPMSVLFLSAAALGLAACAYGYGGEYGGARTPYYYDGFYDGYYGSAYGGYWGSDGFFYFLLNRNGAYRRDNDRHFRRDQHEGFRPFHLRDPRDHEGRERPPQPPRPH